MSLSRGTVALVVLGMALGLGGCKERNTFVPPPPAEVGVAQPVSQNVTPYLVETGNTQAVESVDLVARVEGFLTSIDYVDGTPVKKGDTLFVVEPALYQAKLLQAQSQLKAAQAALVLSQAELDRQTTLYKQNVNSTPMRRISRMPRAASPWPR